MQFTGDEIAYLNHQTLGRLATVDSRGAPQNNPVGFRYNTDLEAIDIGGYKLAASRKFANLGHNDRVSFVVDDIVSMRPWRVRCVEIRGRAEALTDQDPLQPGFASELIRIHPERVISFGLSTEGASAPDAPQ